MDSRQWTTKIDKRTDRITLQVSRLDGNPNRAKVLQNRLERTLGIERAYVSPTTEMVYIVYDPSEIDVKTIQQKLEGFEVDLTKVSAK